MTQPKKLRLNGREMNVISNQIVFDFDFDLLGNLSPQAEPTTAAEPGFMPRQKPTCSCGAKHNKIEPYMMGHSTWCDVHEDKTPVM